jgi:hypothetical protein
LFSAIPSRKLIFRKPSALAEREFCPGRPRIATTSTERPRRIATRGARQPVLRSDETQKRGYLIFPTCWARGGGWKQGQALAIRATTAALKSTGEPITATLLTRKNLGTYGSGATEVSVRLTRAQDATRLQSTAGKIVRVRAP